MPRTNRVARRHVEVGRNRKQIVRITPEAFAKEATLAACVTSASVQGDTCSGKVCIADLSNIHMRKKDVLEMCAGRATTAENLRFL